MQPSVSRRDRSVAEMTFLRVMQRRSRLASCLSLAAAILLTAGWSSQGVAGAAKSSSPSSVGVTDTDLNKSALDYLNGIRAGAGLPAITSDPRLMQAAKNHMNYLVINRGDPTLAGFNSKGVPNAHYEVPGMPGFTGVSDADRYAALGGSGYAAGVISFVGEPRTDINNWLSGPLHRVWLLSNYSLAGYAAVSGGPAELQFGGTPSPNPPLVLWPYPGMAHVPLSYGGETPDPVPSGTDRSNGIGYAITAQQGPQTVPFTSLTLRDASGTEIPTVEGVATGYATKGTRFPIGSLKPSATYTVTATINTSSGLESRTWSFTTMARPPTLSTIRVQRDPGGVLVQWGDPSGVATAFEVRRYSRASAGGLTEESSIRLPANVRFFLDGGPFTSGAASWWTVLPLGESDAETETYRLYAPGSISSPARPRWHSHWVGQSPYQAMAPGEVGDFWVDFVNLGNQPWVRGNWSTEAHLALNGDDQRPATDWGMNPGAWLATDRLATHEQTVVNPGDVAHFAFKIRAPLTPGRYVLDLRPVIDGVTWMEDDGVFWIINVASPYHSRWIEQSAYPTLTVGQVTTVSARFRNTGTSTWVKGTSTEIRLGINGDDRSFSQLGMAVAWPFSERVAIQDEPSVLPGGSVTFTFKIRGATPGTYQLHLRPVIDGLAWLEDDGVFLVVTVRGP